MADDQIDIAGIPQTALTVLTSPAAFFREMPKTGGFAAPLLFMVAMGVVGGLVRAATGLLHMSLAHAGIMTVASVIVLPVMIAIFGFIGAAIVFVIWKLLGSEESYETAYRCVAYMAVLTPIHALLGAVPYAGSVASPVISTFFIVIASVEVHRISSTKAWGVFGTLGAILIFLGVGGEIAARRMRAGGLEWQRQVQAQSQVWQQQAQALQQAAQSAQNQMQQRQQLQQQQAPAAPSR